jgi:hypothetical protein
MINSSETPIILTRFLRVQMQKIPHRADAGIFVFDKVMDG